VYTLPFYTTAVSFKDIVGELCSEPFFCLELHRVLCPFILHISVNRPPVILIGVDEHDVDPVVQLRSHFSDNDYNPYIVVVARSNEECTTVALLNHGADRVVSAESCTGPILRALVKSLLPKPHQSFNYPPYIFDVQTQTVSIRGKSIRLRKKSFDFAHYIFSHNGSHVSKDVLLREIWGIEYVCDTRRVETQASRMRKHLLLDGTYGWTIRTRRRGFYGVFPC